MTNRALPSRRSVCFSMLSICRTPKRLVNRNPILNTNLPFRLTDSSKLTGDQSTSASWWQSHLTSPLQQATHGLVQTHPALSGGVSRPAAPGRATGSTPRTPPASASLRNPSPTGGFPSFVNPNPKSPFRHLDFSSSATAELRRNPNLSAPDECARACREGEPPRICYYHFTLEYYTVLGA
jgi:hypothetical protein